MYKNNSRVFPQIHDAIFLKYCFKLIKVNDKQVNKIKKQNIINNL